MSNAPWTEALLMQGCKHIGFQYDSKTNNNPQICDIVYCFFRVYNNRKINLFDI